MATGLFTIINARTTTVVQGPKWPMSVEVANRFIHRIDCITDTPATDATATLEWQDDDDVDTNGDPVFKTARTLNIKKESKFITRCGVTNNRRFRMTFRPSSVDYKDWIRHYGLVVVFTKGLPGQV